MWRATSCRKAGCAQLETGLRLQSQLLSAGRIDEFLFKQSFSEAGRDILGVKSVVEMHSQLVFLPHTSF